MRQANGAAVTARPERKAQPLGRPVAYLLAEMEPGLKQMLTVRRPSFRWSLKLRLLQNLAIVEMSSLLQGMSDSPESNQHRGVPSEDLRAGVLAMLHMRTGDGYGLFIVQQKMSLSSSTALANAEKKGHLHND